MSRTYHHIRWLHGLLLGGRSIKHPHAKRIGSLVVRMAQIALEQYAMYDPEGSKSTNRREDKNET